MTNKQILFNNYGLSLFYSSNNGNWNNGNLTDRQSYIFTSAYTTLSSLYNIVVISAFIDYYNIYYIDKLKLFASVLPIRLIAFYKRDKLTLS